MGINCFVAGSKPKMTLNAVMPSDAHSHAKPRIVTLFVLPDAMPDHQLRYQAVIAKRLFLGGEVSLQVGGTVVVAATAGAGICMNISSVLDTKELRHIPSALFPHAQVLVGILFSSAALAQSVVHSLAIWSRELHGAESSNYRMDVGGGREAYCTEEQAACHKSKLLPWRTRTRRCYVRSRPLLLMMGG